MNFGLFTDYTLKFHEEHYKENFGGLLKRSFILFDELVYCPTQYDYDKKNYIQNILAESKCDNIKEVVKYFRPAFDFFPQEELMGLKMIVDPNSSLKFGPNHVLYREFINTYLQKNYGFNKESVSTAEEFDKLNFYWSALSADFTVLFQLVEKYPDMSALYTDLHRDAYLYTYGDKMSTPERVIKEISSLSYFDFAQFTWDEIFEIKRSGYAQDFRDKLINEFIPAYTMGNSVEEVNAQMNRYIKESLFDYMKLNTPKIYSDLAEGIAGIFCAPISIYSVVKTYLQNRSKKKDNGWLFFIQEARDKRVDIRQYL